MIPFISHYLRDFEQTEEIKNMIKNEEYSNIKLNFDKIQCVFLFMYDMNKKIDDLLIHEKYEKIFLKISKHKIVDDNDNLIKFPTILNHLNKNKYILENNILNVVINKTIFNEYSKNYYNKRKIINYNFCCHSNKIVNYLPNSIKTLETEYYDKCKFNNLSNSLKIFNNKSEGRKSLKLRKLPFNVIYIENMKRYRYWSVKNYNDDNESDDSDDCDFESDLKMNNKVINNILKIKTFKTLINLNKSLDVQFKKTKKYSVNAMKSIRYSIEKHDNKNINTLEHINKSTKCKIVKKYKINNNLSEISDDICELEKVNYENYIDFYKNYK
jgi:hypothetical protein